jgi:uncharacterized membrane-anchored protein YjiN (DUF445 family)
MTSSNTLFYNLNDFNNILFDDFQYKLPESVYDIINSLSTKLGVSVNREKEKDKEKSKEYHKPRNHKRNHNSAFMSDEGKNEESWTQLRSFKSTVMEKKTEGVEKTMNDIRSCLNKISAKNYDSKKNEIIEYINTFYSDPTMEKSEEIEKIANNIFEIASTNKFFSELYAELYKSLVEHFEIFQDILNRFIINFTDTMHNIQYVDPNEDYDKFCAYNKLNDMRKATVVFIVNLAKKGVLEPETLISISSKTFSILMENINQPNNINEVEEITENIFLLVTQSISILKVQSGWSDILEHIKTLSQLKVKDRPSMSSRAIFKYMDIMDKIQV